MSVGAWFDVRRLVAQELPGVGCPNDDLAAYTRLQHMRRPVYAHPKHLAHEPEIPLLRVGCHVFALIVPLHPIVCHTASSTRSTFAMFDGECMADYTLVTGTTH